MWNERARGGGRILTLDQELLVLCCVVGVAGVLGCGEEPLPTRSREAPASADAPASGSTTDRPCMQIPEGVPHAVITKEEIRRAFMPARACFCENWSVTAALESPPTISAILDHETKSARVSFITRDEWGEIEETAGPIIACMNRKLANVTFEVGKQDVRVSIPWHHFSCWPEAE